MAYKGKPFALGKYKDNLYVIKNSVYIPEFYNLSGVYSDSVDTSCRFKSLPIHYSFTSNYINQYNTFTYSGFIVYYPLENIVELHFQFTKKLDIVNSVKVTKIIDTKYQQTRIVNSIYPTDGSWHIIELNVPSRYKYKASDRFELAVEITDLARYGLPVLRYNLPIFVTTYAYRDIVDTSSAFPPHDTKVKVYRDIIVRATYIKFDKVRTESIDTSNVYKYIPAQNNANSNRYSFVPKYLDTIQESTNTNNAYVYLPSQQVAISIQSWYTQTTG